MYLLVVQKHPIFIKRHTDYSVHSRSTYSYIPSTCTPSKLCFGPIQSREHGIAQQTSRSVQIITPQTMGANTPEDAVLQSPHADAPNCPLCGKSFMKGMCVLSVYRVPAQEIRCNPDQRNCDDRNLTSRTSYTESTRKRHIYYCRTKQANPGIARRRSCIHCIRSKVRCRPSPPDSETNGSCARCDSRGLGCDFVTQVETIPRLDSGPYASVTTDSATIKTNSRQSPPASAPRLSSDGAITLSGANSAADDDSISREFISDRLWDLDYPGAADLTADWDAYGDMLGSTSSAPDLSHVFAPSLSMVPATVATDFNARPVAQSGNSAMVHLLRRILQTYPYRLLRKETFPPFICPMLYTWAEAKRGPALQVSCVSVFRHPPPGCPEYGIVHLRLGAAQRCMSTVTDALLQYVGVDQLCEPCSDVQGA